MTQYEKDLILSVADEQAGALRHLYMICQHHRKFEILNYLLKNKITGRTLIWEVEKTHNHSILNFMAWVIKKIDSDVVKRPIICGKHFG